MAKYTVAKVEDIPVGTRKLVMAGGRPIAIFNIKGEYFGLLNRCPHQGASLCHGRLTGLVESREPGTYKVTRAGEILRCPWHGWEFDVRTGQSWCEPDKTKVRTYRTGIEAGSELVKGPYKAETFPISVEEEYVVVEL